MSWTSFKQYIQFPTEPRHGFEKKHSRRVGIAHKYIIDRIPLTLKCCVFENISKVDLIFHRL
jgi:hypothetical protein